MKTFSHCLALTLYLGRAYSVMAVVVGKWDSSLSSDLSEEGDQGTSLANSSLDLHN